MKSAMILLLIVAVVGLFAARSAAHISEDEEPACCNECGACDRRAPEFARCQCLDLVRQCPPSCKSCVQAPQLIEPPLYRCLDMDLISYFACQRKCADTAASK